jgi:DNA polymerase V
MKAIVDCNNFYCSCERLFKPNLENKPMVVLSNNDGCIISRSDEAKKLGIKMGVPFFEVRELMAKNKVAVFSSNYNLYGDLSWRVMETLRQIVGPSKVEVYSVDEAFLELDTISDESKLKASVSSKEKWVRMATVIREQVEQWTGIKVSVGIAPTKTLAKLANRLAKKDKSSTNCVMVLNNSADIETALRNTAVEDIWGIGGRYAKKLKESFGIYDAFQLSKISEELASKYLGGVVGARLIRELNGVLSKEMQQELVQKKMIATTRMFGRNVTSFIELREAVAAYTSRAAEKLRRQNGLAQGISIFILAKASENNLRASNSGGASLHFHHGTAYNNYGLLSIPTSNTDELIKVAVSLLGPIFKQGLIYKKAGVIFHDIIPDHATQTNLFVAPASTDKKKLMLMLDNINFSHKANMVHFAATGNNQAWKMKQQYCSARYTTQWEELMRVI